jgi:hypothetical protein
MLSGGEAAGEDGAVPFNQAFHTVRRKPLAITHYCPNQFTVWYRTFIRFNAKAKGYGIAPGSKVKRRHRRGHP